MFFSQCLLSRKGPLRAVWVAAYCHKRLKRNQVTETDICFSVDKILLDGVPVITYRVLGYLLLGVVRIYSKKVEYLFNDCHAALMNIKDLFGSEKFNARRDTLSAPYHSITLPDRFELDAFDFGVLEDVNGGNVMRQEEIMLKDTWISVGIGNYSLDEYCCEGHAADTLAEDILSPYLMDIDMVVSPSHTLSNSKVSTEKLGENWFFEEKWMDFDMLNEDEEVCLDLVRSVGEEHQTGKEQVTVSELPLLEYAKHQFITEDHSLRNSEASIEKLQDNGFSNEEGRGLESFGGAEEEPPVFVPSGEEHEDTNADAEQIKFPEMYSSENRKPHLLTEDHPLSITLDATPESKFPDASGATTPEFIVISTPANKERARIPNKRKCVFDNDVVLANKVLRESIHDSSGLACKRRKVPHTALDVWKACRIPNLSQGFLDPLIPCTSSELRSLYYNKKSKNPEPVEIVETPEKLDLPGSLTVGKSSVELPGSLTVDGSSEQTAIAPVTPVQRSTSIRLFEGPEITNLDRARPVISVEAVEEDSPENQELDLNLINEQINSSDGDSQELHGWSVRTRTVSRYLQKSFLNQKKRREEEVVNLLQVLKGRTRKESARLFYEILVLDTKGFVDVQQDKAYGDILVRQHPGRRQLCEPGGQ